MADVQAFTSWSTTAASNQPSGGTTIGAGLDDNLREIQAQVLSWLSYKGADLASAATVNVGGSAGSVHDVTGTTTITGLGSTAPLGFEVTLQFDAATPIKHNATSLILPTSANITAAAGDVASFIHYSSGNWFCSGYQRKSGAPLTGSGITRGTETATTSGTSIDFTGIPTGTKAICVYLYEVGVSAQADIIIQIGDAGGIETSGYESDWGANLKQDGFLMQKDTFSGYRNNGALWLLRVDTSGLKWVGSVASSFISSGSSGNGGGGAKDLTAELDRIRLTTSAGTATFNAGAMNILYFT